MNSISSLPARSPTLPKARSAFQISSTAVLPRAPVDTVPHSVQFKTVGGVVHTIERGPGGDVLRVIESRTGKVLEQSAAREVLRDCLAGGSALVRSVVGAGAGIALELALAPPLGAVQADSVPNAKVLEGLLKAFPELERVMDGNGGTFGIRNKASKVMVVQRRKDSVGYGVNPNLDCDLTLTLMSRESGRSLPASALAQDSFALPGSIRLPAALQQDPSRQDSSRQDSSRQSSSPGSAAVSAGRATLNAMVRALGGGKLGPALNAARQGVAAAQRLQAAGVLNPVTLQEARQRLQVLESYAKGLEQTNVFVSGYEHYFKEHPNLMVGAHSLRQWDEGVTFLDAAWKAFPKDKGIKALREQAGKLRQVRAARQVLADASNPAAQPPSHKAVNEAAAFLKNNDPARNDPGFQKIAAEIHRQSLARSEASKIAPQAAVTSPGLLPAPPEQAEEETWRKGLDEEQQNGLAGLDATPAEKEAAAKLMRKDRQMPAGEALRRASDDGAQGSGNGGGIRNNGVVGVGASPEEPDGIDIEVIIGPAGASESAQLRKLIQFYEKAATAELNPSEKAMLMLNLGLIYIKHKTGDEAIIATIKQRLQNLHLKTNLPSEWTKILDKLRNSCGDKETKREFDKYMKYLDKYTELANTESLEQFVFTIVYWQFISLPAHSLQKFGNASTADNLYEAFVQSLNIYYKSTISKDPIKLLLFENMIHDITKDHDIGNPTLEQQFAIIRSAIRAFTDTFAYIDYSIKDATQARLGRAPAKAAPQTPAATALPQPAPSLDDISITAEILGQPVETVRADIEQRGITPYQLIEEQAEREAKPTVSPVPFQVPVETIARTESAALSSPPGRVLNVIASFRSRILEKLFLQGKAKGVQSNLVQEILARLDAINRIKDPKDLKDPAKGGKAGWKAHPLNVLGREVWSLWLTGCDRIVFEWSNGRASSVRIETDYHGKKINKG